MDIETMTAEELREDNKHHAHKIIGRILLMAQLVHEKAEIRANYDGKTNTLTVSFLPRMAIKRRMFTVNMNGLDTLILHYQNEVLIGLLTAENEMLKFIRAL